MISEGILISEETNSEVNKERRKKVTTKNKSYCSESNDSKKQLDERSLKRASLEDISGSLLDVDYLLMQQMQEEKSVGKNRQEKQARSRLNSDREVIILSSPPTQALGSGQAKDQPLEYRKTRIQTQQRQAEPRLKSAQSGGKISSKFGQQNLGLGSLSALENQSSLKDGQSCQTSQHELAMPLKTPQKPKVKKLKTIIEIDCSVCFIQHDSENNPIVYCSKCNKSFHKFCYGILDLPKGKYYCDECME